MAFRAARLSSVRIVPRVTIGRVTSFIPRDRPNVIIHDIAALFKATKAYNSASTDARAVLAPQLSGDYGQIRGSCSLPWMIAVD